MLTTEQIRTWVAALRSGDYPQAQGCLARYDKDGRKGYCCLGVANEVLGLGERATALSLRDWLPNQLQTKLIRLNDLEGKDFDEIADFIEAQCLTGDSK